MTDKPKPGRGETEKRGYQPEPRKPFNDGWKPKETNETKPAAPPKKP